MKEKMPRVARHDTWYLLRPSNNSRITSHAIPIRGASPVSTAIQAFTIVYSAIQFAK